MKGFVSMLALTLLCMGCADSERTSADTHPTEPAAAILLTGAGATFPGPIYSKWFSEYHKKFPDIQINYQPVGSGGGIRQMLEGTVDFGASDGPMSEELMRQAKTPILHFPT